MSGGVIALCAQELSRFTECNASVGALDRPVGSEFHLVVGGTMAAAWNQVASRVLDSEAEWLMLLNDDHIYPADTVTRLLARDVEVVTGTYLHRSFPFAPVLYDALERKEGHQWYRPFIPQPEDRGLHPIVGCGDGCLLVRRRVLEAIPPPIFEVSKFRPDLQSTDLIFCEKVREAGFQIWADLDLQIGHMIVAPVFPQHLEGRWRAILLQRGGVAIELPQASPGPALTTGPHREENANGESTIQAKG